MSSQLDSHVPILGHAGDADLALNLDRLIGSHACIIANSGGGKSGLLRKVLEQTHGAVQHIVLDVEDEFYSLRERFDYIIAGGEGGDAPISIDGAASLATATLEHGFSLIVQLNDLGADAPEFVTRFLGGLMAAPRALWRPVLVTIDELQRFASKDSGEATPAIKDLMFRGRKRGFTGLFASLRMAEIDPGIRGMVNNWMLGRFGQALDRKTMADQLGFSAAEGRDKLEDMVERHFWARGPALTLKPTLFKVADVETTPVHAGQAKVPTPPAPEALRAILAGLASKAVEPVQDSQNATDPATDNNRLSYLERRVADLETERDALRAMVDRKNERIAELLDERADRENIVAAAIETMKAALPTNREPGTLDAEVVDGGNEVEDKPRSTNAAGIRHAPQADKAGPRSTSQSGSIVRPGPTRDPRQSEGNGALGGPQQRILDALAWWKALGHADATNEQTAFIAEYSPKSTSYQKARGALKSSGLIDYPSSGVLALTVAGEESAHEPNHSPTADELRQRVLGRLGGPHQRILSALIAAYPAELSNQECAERADYSPLSTSYQKARGSLRSLNAIDYPSSGFLRAADWLFP